MIPPARASRSPKALHFVLLIGIVSLFADFTYEGSRSITGQFLAVLGTSAAVVATVAGLGELLGYGLRIVTGRLSERTQKFWPITLFGYVIQMASVPLLALAPNWRIAALLILTERVGKPREESDQTPRCRTAVEVESFRVCRPLAKWPRPLRGMAMLRQQIN